MRVKGQVGVWHLPHVIAKHVNEEPAVQHFLSQAVYHQGRGQKRGAASNGRPAGRPKRHRVSEPPEKSDEMPMSVEETLLALDDKGLKRARKKRILRPN